ncbi:MAG: hypothetical protein A2W18_09990 [Candidatus Muproteobacteria bacterium RBG_16_60_9]|uniref:Uncharacterized protein n=1 Tax=Candidatus Muproteobacteria bacterium RBG_16_60_9 TaxID=1817755 RepID=A0A1F6VII1_9PROT|nr:MAG: hypothetical protein A2W18_09990 [Candidatus Muproteobacteria bacterium RBG_16_60_9]
MLEALRQSAADVRTVDDYKEWTKANLRSILPHQAMISGWGHRHAGGVGLDLMVTVDFPAEHLDKIRNRVGALDTPILWRWLVTEKPVTFDADNPWPDAPPQWLESFRGFGLRNVLAHAQWDTERVAGLITACIACRPRLEITKRNSLPNSCPCCTRSSVA